MASTIGAAVYRSGIVEPSVVNTDKVFWVQAEMIAALTEALVQRDEPRYATALVRALVKLVDAFAPAP